MCGIALIISNSDAVVNSSLDSFQVGLAHRGPDGSSALKEKVNSTFIGFAHTRLSIIDLSSSGNQPMIDPLNGNVIIFNGEIYNYLDLKEDLIESGEVFESNSDTEVLLKGFKLWGIKKLLHKARGMYGFCLYDKEHNEIFIIRDPLGIKPLYYAYDGDNFVCASEIKSIISLNIFSNKILRSSIDSYLAYGSVQPPNTIYESVKILLPGHMLQFKVSSEINIFPNLYWEWDEHTNKEDISIDNISSALDTSVSRHLVSDVPVGVLLSGGYDSTAIALLASQLSSNSVCSYTLSFADNKGMSENINARKIANFCGIQNESLIVSNQDIIDSFDNFFISMDQPSDDGFNVFIISRMLKQYGNKVFLHGVGGDELFGGYPSFTDVPRALQLKKFNSWILRKSINFLDNSKIRTKKIKELLSVDFNLLYAMYVRRNIFGINERRDLMREENNFSIMSISEGYENFLEKSINSSKSLSSKISMHELMQYSSSKLLIDGDVMSMSQGLEFRFPFLDIDLISDVLSLKNNISSFSNLHKDKSIIKRSIQNFPNGLMMKRKMGFTLPITDFIKTEIINNLDDINSVLIEDFKFCPNGLDKFWNWYQESEEPNSWLRGWVLMSLVNWSKHHSFSIE